MRTTAFLTAAADTTYIGPCTLGVYTGPYSKWLGSYLRPPIRTHKLHMCTQHYVVLVVRGLPTRHEHRTAGTRAPAAGCRVLWQLVQLGQLVQ